MSAQSPDLTRHEDASSSLLSTDTDSALQALLQWYTDHGVIETVDRVATDKFSWEQGPHPLPSSSTSTSTSPSTPAPPRQHAAAPSAAAASPRLNESMTPCTAPATTPIKPGTAPSTDTAIAAATQLARHAPDIDALRAAIEASELCALKAGARNTVIDDGIFGADLMILGEAPGRDEDRIGRPFVGRAGQLLDRMLAAIGRSRATDVHITNVIYWRPPGNRNPTKAEIAICLPFVRRIIDLARPKFIMTLGNVPTQALFPALPGITRARGQRQGWHLDDRTEIPVLPSLHPAYLLRQPAQKRHAWQDLKTVQAALAGAAGQ